MSGALAYDPDFLFEDGDPDTFAMWGKEPPHAGQWQLWEDRHRLVDPDDPCDTLFAACGPRWGKDRLSVWTNIDLLMDIWIKRTAENSPLIPRVLSWVIAPTGEDYDQVFLEYKTHTRGLPRYINETKGRERIVLFPGGHRYDREDGLWFVFKSGWEKNRMVGAGPDSLHITEGAGLATPVYEQAQGRRASPGRGGFQIINGTITDNPADWFRRMVREGIAGSDRMLYVNQPSWHNPTLEEPQLRILREIKRTVSRRTWVSHWGAQLVAPGGQVFPGLQHVCTANPALIRAIKGGMFIWFYDPAGTGADWNSISIFRFDGEYRLKPKQIALVRWDHLPPTERNTRLASIMQVFSPGIFGFDDTGRIEMGYVMKKLCRQHSLRYKPIKFTNELKRSMVDNASAKIESGACELLTPECEDGAIQYGEFQDFRRITTAEGTVKYRAPEGQHDDTVTSTMGCLWFARKPLPVSARGVLKSKGWM